MTDKLRAAHEKLQQAVAEIASGDDWKRMLQVVSKFHRYSFNNHLMIFLQRPDATVVAGFNRWKSLGRFVKKGEKGIAIFAPCKYKTKIETDAGEEKSVQQIRGFRVVHVFDISQTEGDDLPDLDAVRPKLLDADAPEGLWDALVAQANAAGFEVTRNRRLLEQADRRATRRGPGAGGQEPDPRARPRASARRGVAEVAEVEVESVAYIVCDAIGLDSGDYSFAYVARWAEGSTDLLKETGERVIACAKSILTALERTARNGVLESHGTPDRSRAPNPRLEAAERPQEPPPTEDRGPAPSPSLRPLMPAASSLSESQAPQAGIGCPPRSRCPAPAPPGSSLVSESAS
jgi:hypothetical protein